MSVSRTTTTAYDVVAYPSAAIPETHPDHLATIARLHGLAPPPVATARVLDIGGGDGVNLLAMAELLPDAEFLSLDLAEAPVARGRTIAARAGIGNVRIAVGDILALADTLEERFDYVIAHGVYAWVPEPVRAALLQLIARVLSPDGVAYVSYNALPGGHLRQRLRERVLAAIGPVPHTHARHEAAVPVLRALADDPAEDAALRKVAARALAKDRGTLLHDELGEVYAPQALATTIAAAERHGLRFLNDADRDLFASGMPGPGVAEADVVARAQASDDAETRYFHKTLFVRHGAAPQRALVPRNLRDLLIAAPCTQTGADTFAADGMTFAIKDRRLVRAVATAAKVWPKRLRVGDLVHDNERLAAIHRLYLRGAVELHTLPYAGAATPGERPRAGALARALLATGAETIFTLDHRAVALDDPGARMLLGLCDGTRDRTTLARAWAIAGFDRDVPLDAALARFTQLALLRA